MYKPIEPKKNPRYVSNLHATIVVPTIDSGPEIVRAIKSWLENDPYEIIFVTIPKAQASLEALARSVDPHRRKVRVITVEKGNKRNQMVAGINQVKTPITIFCDDDVLWPKRFIEYTLAPFEDSKMGGVGTNQTVLPVGKRMTIWEIMAAFRVTMRTIECTASTFIDGGVTCLSGRTAIYRTSILRSSVFQYEFTHEYWNSKYHLNSGDDKFLTRWMQNNGWKTFIQTSRHTELLSTFKNDWTFLKQLLRWTRNSWRSDIKSLIFNRTIWKRHPWTAFTMFDKFFNPITVFFGPASVAYIIAFSSIFPVWVYLVSYLVYLLATRLLKYTPHFITRPQDIVHLPALLLFNFYFALLKTYCLFTLHVTAWGTRTGADNTRKESETIDLSIFKVHHVDIVDVPESLEERERLLKKTKSQWFARNAVFPDIERNNSSQSAENIGRLTAIQTTPLINSLPTSRPSRSNSSIGSASSGLNALRYMPSRESDVSRVDSAIELQQKPRSPGGRSP